MPDKIKSFQKELAAMRKGLAKAKKACRELPKADKTAHYVEKCMDHLNSIERSLDEIDGSNGYLSFVQDPSKIRGS